LNFYLKQ